MITAHGDVTIQRPIEEVFDFAVVLREVGQDLLDRGSPAVGVVRRQQRLDQDVQGIGVRDVRDGQAVGVAFRPGSLVLDFLDVVWQRDFVQRLADRLTARSVAASASSASAPGVRASPGRRAEASFGGER